jgi:hypothetical protein
VRASRGAALQQEQAGECGRGDSRATREPESFRVRLRLRSQGGLRERVEELDRGTGDAENLTAATPQGDPGFESRDAFRAEAVDERLRQVVWQCMRHAGQFSQSASFAKPDLTLMPREFSIQRWVSQNDGRGGRGPPRRRAVSLVRRPHRRVPQWQRQPCRFPPRCCNSAPTPGPMPGSHGCPCRDGSTLHRSPRR